MSESVDKRTATQRIEDLEKVASVLYQNLIQMKNVTDSLLGMQGDVGLLKDALKLLNRKTEAIIQTAAPETGITVASVSALVVKMTVDEMANQVSAYVANGHLAASDEVAANSYLVCEEYNADGTLANPRIQFRLDSQDQATQDTLKGKKVGDTVSFGENKFDAKITEIYSVVEPKAPEAAPAQEASADAPVAEAAEATETEAPAATETTEAATA